VRLRRSLSAFLNAGLAGEQINWRPINPMFNQYSILFAFGAVFMLFAVLLLILRQPRWEEYLSLAVIGVGMVVAWIILHPTQTPLMDDAKKVQAMIGQGQPVLLEFQSPY